MVGFILLVSGGKEHDTFWFFYAILEKTHNLNPFDGLASMYEEGFPLYMQYVQVFNELFEEYIPDLYDNFQMEGIPNEMWLQKWFMSCFTINFPMGLCVRIWDNLMAHGTKFILNVSLALLYLMKDELITLDMGGINEYFKKLKDDESCEYKLLPPYEDIIQEA